MCDVAREDASVIISDLRDLGIHHDGSISLSDTDTISDFAVAAVKHAPGLPADAVIWEELDQRTSESVELSAVFLIYMVLAALIAAIGIFLDSAILVVGAMVVGPEFGPVAGVCVAVVERRGELARRSALALVVGFALAIGATVLATLASTPPTSSPRPSTPPTTRSPRASRARTRSRSSSPCAPARRACSASRQPSPVR